MIISVGKASAGAWGGLEPGPGGPDLCQPQGDQGRRFPFTLS